MKNEDVVLCFGICHAGVTKFVPAIVPEIPGDMRHLR